MCLLSDELRQLADDYWQAILDEEPTERHLLGDYSDVGSYEEVSREAEQRHVATLRDFATRAEAVETGSLDPEEVLTRGVIISSATAHADLLDTPLGCRNADPVHGVQVSLALVIGLLAVPDQAVADAMPAKLDAIGTHLRQLAERTREGAGSGWVSPAFAVAATIEQIEKALAVPLAEDPVVTAVQLPEGVDADAVRGALREAVERSLRPGLEDYRDALRGALPHARSEEECGLSWLPGGSDAYDATLRYYTTTEKSAQEIHEIGLAQVAKLADEYRSLGPEVVGTGDLQEIFEAMRTDPKLHFEHGDELVDQSRIALARAEAAMADWFEVVPQAPCAVQGTEVGAEGLLLPARHRRVPGRHLLRQHRRPLVVGPVRARGDGVPRGSAGPPPPARDRLGAARHDAGVPQARAQLGVRRGLGSLHRAALRRDGSLLGVGRPDGDVQRRLDACLPAGRRHRPARARAGAASRRSTTWSPTRRSPRGSAGPRSTATSATRARPRRT